MKKNKDKLFVISLCLAFFIIFFSGGKLKMASIEDLDIYVGLGVGIEKGTDGNVEYKASTSANMYEEEEKVVSILNTGIAPTIGETREHRQRKIGKHFFLGLTQVYLIDEVYAQYGMRNLIDILFKNPIINDNVYMVVCKDKNEEYFTCKIPGYENTAEYISEMLRNSFSYNFFKDNFKLKNVVLSVDAEGKNVACPYLEKTEDGIKIAGSAVFIKDKLGVILNIEDTKTMNMLRENKVKGMLSIQKGPKEYINYYAQSKRKIKCKKEGDKYIFTIDLSLVGEIVNNQQYKNMTGDMKVVKEFEKDMEKDMEQRCNNFLEKMKNEYKIDLLQLGWVAAAKYGRDTGVNWNEVVTNSDIKVKVKVKVDKVGRGQY